MVRYRSGRNELDPKSCDPFIKTAYFHTETYRSGRNELDSKSSCPQGHVGSNPTVSARPEQAGACSGFLQPVRLLAGQPLVPQAPDACNDEAPRPLRTKRAVARTLLWRGASGEIFHCQQMSHDLGCLLPCSRGRVSPGGKETQNAPGPGIPVRARHVEAARFYGCRRWIWQEGRS